MSEAPDDLSPGPGPSPGRPEHVPPVLPTSPNSDYPFFSRFPLAADTATMAMSRSRSDGAAGRPPPKLTLTEVDSGRPYPLAEGGDRPSALAEGCGSGGRSSFDPASRGHSPDARPESAIPFRGPPAMWGPPVSREAGPVAWVCRCLGLLVPHKCYPERLTTLADIDFLYAVA